MNHGRALLSHQVSIEQSLHLFRAHIVLMHILTKLVCVALKQDHRPVVHLHVDVIVHHRRAGVAAIDVLVRDALRRRHLTERIPVLQRHVAETR